MVYVCDTLGLQYTRVLLTEYDDKLLGGGGLKNIGVVQR